MRDVAGGKARRGEELPAKREAAGWRAAPVRSAMAMPPSAAALRQAPELAEIALVIARAENIGRGGRRRSELAEIGTARRIVEIDADEVEIAAEDLRCLEHCLEMRRPGDRADDFAAPVVERELFPGGRVEAAAMISEAADIDLDHLGESVEGVEFIVGRNSAAAVVDEFLDHDFRRDVLVDPFARQLVVILPQPGAAQRDRRAAIEL